ncbi:MAG: thioredoxin family protein [Turicibacter sp.]|nr:thioredoxin family protein [Turicibacter sp.]
MKNKREEFEVKEIVSIEQYQEVIAHGKVIVLFTANWCPDCMVIKPFLPKIVEKYSEYQFYTVNRDQLMDLCIELDIFGIPSFVAFKNGQEVGRLVNKERKTREQIEEFIESLV